MAYTTIEVTGRSLQLTAGTVKLTDEQAKARAYGVVQAKGRRKGYYTITKPVEFKRGEVLEVNEEDLDKVSRQHVRFPDDGPSKRKTIPEPVAEDDELDAEDEAAAEDIEVPDPGIFEGDQQ